MKLALAIPGGVSTEGLDVSATTFGRDFNEALVHQVVTAYLAGGRSGTRAQLTRAEVRGGGAKPWAQKGTGRARAGTIRSPIWRGGGRTFAAGPTDHSQKVNKKMYRAAMQAILSELVRQDRLVVVQDLALARPKTRDLLDRLSGLGLKNVQLSARNVSKIAVCQAAHADPVNLIKFEKVLMTVAAVRQFEEVLK